MMIVMIGVLFSIVVGVLLLAAYFMILDISHHMFGVDLRTKMTPKYAIEKKLTSFDPQHFNIQIDFVTEMSLLGYEVRKVKKTHWSGNLFGELKTYRWIYKIERIK